MHNGYMLLAKGAKFPGVESTLWVYSRFRIRRSTTPETSSSAEVLFNVKTGVSEDLC